MKFVTLAAGGLCLLAVMATESAAKAEIDADLKKQCASCHAFEKPSHPSVERLWTRKGPDLWYAGDKFNQDWLVAWLQKPTPIRPGGVMWFKNAKPGEPRDQIDQASVPAHVAVDAAAAAKFANALMALRGEGLVSEGAFKPEAVNLTMGKMAFGKLRGCVACHEDKPGNGGVSGPGLHDAGERLNPDYVLAYIKDPQAFDRYVWMPRLPLSEPDLQRLTGYLMSLKGAK